MSTSKLTLGDAIKQRGSLHTLSDDVNIPDGRVEEIVSEAVLHSPTAFNCQSSRVVVLLKEEHKKFWDIALEVAKAEVPEPFFKKFFEPRIPMFRAAYGTILFYESELVLEKMRQDSKTSAVADKMTQWSEHGSAMLQYAVWTMLCAEDLGVNLQHYSPLVDSRTAKEWDIPSEWKMKAQMVFGKPAGPRVMKKEFQPVEERMMVFGK